MSRFSRSSNIQAILILSVIKLGLLSSSLVRIQTAPYHRPPWCKAHCLRNDGSLSRLPAPQRWTASRRVSTRTGLTPCQTVRSSTAQKQLLNVSNQSLMGENFPKSYSSWMVINGSIKNMDIKRNYPSWAWLISILHCYQYMAGDDYLASPAHRVIMRCDFQSQRALWRLTSSFQS